VAALRSEQRAADGDDDDHADVAGTDMAGTYVVGSAVGAAGFSFVAFATGAVIPILPFLVTSGTAAIAAAAVVVGVALFAIGATVGVLVGVNAEHRAGAGVAGGDQVDVDIDLDTAPRQVSVPADFAAALDVQPAARRTFDGLSYSNKSWHVLQVEGAKTDETRQRRIAKSVDILKQGRAR
jgi:predicted membrane channel-forming protein YqfA (hemolysin III family)